MDEKTFNDAYQQFAGSIFRYIYFKVSDYDIASDLTADTFTRYWKVLKKESVVSPKAFLFSIASGIVIDFYRKKRQKNMSLETIDERLLGRYDTHEEKLSLQQDIIELLQKLQKLKKEYQDIILLYYLEELTIKEISTIVKKRENNIRVLLHRAMQSLKKIV